MNTTSVVIRKHKKFFFVAAAMVLATGPSQAQESKVEEKVKVPAGFQQLDLESGGEMVKTKESLVTISGVQYRKVEYQKKIFYLRLLADNASSVGEMICGDEAHIADPQRRVEGQIEMTERSSFFVDGLQRRCTNNHGRTMVEITPALRIGFLLKDQPKDAIQNKRIFIMPGLGAGASGEF